MNRLPPGLGLRYLAVSVAAAALGYLAFAFWGGWSQVLDALVLVGGRGLAVLLALSLTNYALRFWRWQLYLQALECTVPAGRSAVIYVAGFALTTTPGKAGEMLRGVFLKRYGVSYAKSGAAFVSERLSDLIAIALIAVGGLLAYPQGQLIAVIAVATVAVALLFVAHRRWLAWLDDALVARTGRIACGSRKVIALFVEATRCHTPGLLLGATALSLIAWLAEAFGAYLVMHWMGIDATLLFGFAAYSLAMLAGALSFLPGGLGGTEAVMLSILIWGGVPGPQAVAGTVIIRLATLWFAVGLGVTALLGGNPGGKSPQPEGT